MLVGVPRWQPDRRFRLRPAPAGQPRRQCRGRRGGEQPGHQVREPGDRRRLGSRSIDMCSDGDPICSRGQIRSPTPAMSPPMPARPPIIAGLVPRPSLLCRAWISSGGKPLRQVLSPHSFSPSSGPHVASARTVPRRRVGLRLGAERSARRRPQIGEALIRALRRQDREEHQAVRGEVPAPTPKGRPGANDMSAHVQYMMDNRSNTGSVLGGYSLGAAVTDVVLAVPLSFFTFKRPCRTGRRTTRRGRAVRQRDQWVDPSARSARSTRNAPSSCATVTTSICNPTDPQNWQDHWPDHLAPAYISAGMVNQAADFVAGRI